MKCAGDGVTVEWFQTELETSDRFLAIEVKPEKESGCEEEVDIRVPKVLILHYR